MHLAYPPPISWLKLKSTPLGLFTFAMLCHAAHDGFTQVILLIHILLQHILESLVEGHRGREAISSIHIADGDEEYSLSVLRHSVVLGIEHTGEVGVAVALKFGLPLIEQGEKLLTDQGSYILEE